LLVWRTITLPNISDNGPRKSGPIAYAKINIDKTKDCSTSFVTLNSAEIAVSAGATIEEDTGDMNVKDETSSGVSYGQQQSVDRS
jgi:hypothetical protein